MPGTTSIDWSNRTTREARYAVDDRPRPPFEEGVHAVLSERPHVLGEANPHSISDLEVHCPFLLPIWSIGNHSGGRLAMRYSDRRVGGNHRRLIGYQRTCRDRSQRHRSAPAVTRQVIDTDPFLGHLFLAVDTTCCLRPLGVR